MGGITWLLALFNYGPQIKLLRNLILQPSQRKLLRPSDSPRLINLPSPLRMLNTKELLLFQGRNPTASSATVSQRVRFTNAR